MDDRGQEILGMCVPRPIAAVGPKQDGRQALRSWGWVINAAVRIGRLDVKMAPRAAAVRIGLGW